MAGIICTESSQAINWHTVCQAVDAVLCMAENYFTCAQNHCMQLASSLANAYTHVNCSAQDIAAMQHATSGSDAMAHHAAHRYPMQCNTNVANRSAQPACLTCLTPAFVFILQRSWQGSACVAGLACSTSMPGLVASCCFVCMLLCNAFWDFPTCSG